MSQMQLVEMIEQIVSRQASRLVISKPASKAEEYRKIDIEYKGSFYQIAKYTEKQVFHENVSPEQLAVRCHELTEGHFLQINAWNAENEFMIMISRKGSPAYKEKKRNDTAQEAENIPHNRQKNYILQEGTVIEPLVDMGVFTKEGRIVKSMYDKFRQINRFIEIIDDVVRDMKPERLNIIDFGCGKSYLTFVIYYYFTFIRQLEVHMIGLDLKEDVIRKCNAAAQKYHYDKLRFELGDINGFKSPFDVDMVVTLHACDTATDYALYNAIQWKAKLIFSVPCCQHELNAQMKPDNLTLLSHYGIIQERFAALATDAIRGDILEYCGYKTQLLEFVDFDHTPKNILIRAVRRGMAPVQTQKRAAAEIEAALKEFHVEPTLYRLVMKPQGSDKTDNTDNIDNADAVCLNS